MDSFFVVIFYITFLWEGGKSMGNILSYLLPVLAATDSSGSGTSYWAGLEEKLNIAGDATNQFLHLCQDYWYIPMTFAIIAIGCLIMAGGKQGRIQAKSFLWWVIVATAIIMMVPTIIGLITTLFAKEQTTISKL